MDGWMDRLADSRTEQGQYKRNSDFHYINRREYHDDVALDWINYFNLIYKTTILVPSKESNIKKDKNIYFCAIYFITNLCIWYKTKWYWKSQQIKKQN